MRALIERLILSWLKAVAPSGWTDTVLGDLREDFEGRPGRSRRRAVLEAARIASRFTLESVAARLRRPARPKGSRNMDVLYDLRQAARALARTPVFSLVAIFTLAIAIGANTAIYSALSSLVLRPLPFKDGERIVYLWQRNPAMGGFSLSPRREAIDRWREAKDIFEAVEGYGGRSMTLTGGGEPEEIEASFVRPSVFTTLGVQPVVGRPFVDSDTLASATPVAILGHALWQSRFGGQRDLTGLTVTLDEVDYLIVGVMPARFALPMSDDALWVAERNGAEDEFGRTTVAKLARGVTLEQAQAAVAAMRVPGHGEGEWPGHIMTPAEHNGPGIRTALFVLTGAVALLLLIACVNVANLVLSRHAGRRREMAVRHALGASRGRITRYLLAESAILALGGGAAGLVVAFAGLSVMSALRPQNLDVLERLALDANALSFAAAVSLATGLLFGVGPAIAASRLNLNDAIKAGGRSVTSQGHGVRALLTVAQVSLALILLVGAGLLIRSYVKLMAVDPGYSTERLLVVDVSLPASRYPDTRRESRGQFFDAALSSIASLPGVTAASVGSMPARPVMMLAELSIEGRPDVRGRRELLSGGWVTPSYFSALGIALREGRAFTPDDARDGDVVIVSESFAREFWPRESALGMRLQTGGTARWLTVVGVAASVKFGLAETAAARRHQLYFPRSNAAFGSFIIRTTGEPMDLVPAVKASIWAIDDKLPLDRIATARQLLARTASERRFNLTLLGIFAACGLVLAVVGVYGVTALFVGQREREVGIRMALGATRAAVARLVLRQTGLLLLVAVVAGGLGAWWLSRYLSTMVFAIATTDVLTFTAAIAAIVIASVAATLVPLRRATSVDPAIVLRAD